MYINHNQYTFNITIFQYIAMSRIPKTVNMSPPWKENVPDVVSCNKDEASTNGKSLLTQPKPPRSAFMCFTDAKKKEIMSRRGIVKENDDILKVVAQEWRTITENERAEWDEEARNDKVRFEKEKSAYKGPWNIPKRRAKKHPLAPKRPMSAFLKFSKTRRAMVKRDNPDMGNTDVSRLLGEMWRNASPKERRPYVEQEECERANYKENIKKWREDQAKIDAASRTHHESMQKTPEFSQQNLYQRNYTMNGTSGFENSYEEPFENIHSSNHRLHQIHHAVSARHDQECQPSMPVPQMHRSTNYNIPDSLVESQDPSERFVSNTRGNYSREIMSFGYYSRHH